MSARSRNRTSSPRRGGGPPLVNPRRPAEDRGEDEQAWRRRTGQAPVSHRRVHLRRTADSGSVAPASSASRHARGPGSQAVAGNDRSAARHSLSGRRLDGTAGRAPPPRQPPQRLHPLPAGAHRADTHHPPVLRASLGRAARRADRPVELSLTLLEALHRRWVLLLRGLGPAEWEVRYLHPEHGREWTLDEALAMYAWHGEHHTAHITTLRTRKGWI